MLMVGQLADDVIGGTSLTQVVALTAIAGIVAAFLFFVLAFRKKFKILEGRKMGMNFATHQRCPSCDAPLPAVRRPKNFRQMMWGGWTCANCGKEFDKWLKPVEEK
jgi:hypothetical protein